MTTQKTLDEKTINLIIQEGAKQLKISPEEFVKQAAENFAKILKQKQGSITLQFSEAEVPLLQDMAKTNQISIEEMLTGFIRKEGLGRAKSPDGNVTFEEKGLTWERIHIEPPQKVVNYYRYLADVRGKQPETLMVEDLLDKLNADIEGHDPNQWKEKFGLKEALEIQI
jgi:hypothetical protein